MLYERLVLGSGRFQFLEGAAVDTAHDCKGLVGLTEPCHGLDYGYDFKMSV